MAKTQKQEILDYIEQYGSITSMEAFAEIGCTKLSTRISELRREGWEFDIDYISYERKDHRVTEFARYSNARKVR